MLSRKFVYHVACWVLLSAPSTSADITVIDDAGDALSLDQPARRIVSLAPNITELLFFVGAGQFIVGADEHSTYPEQAKWIPRVSNHAVANYEVILSVKPDLVIAWQLGNGAAMVNRLRQLKLPVFVIEPRSMSSIPQLITRFGKLTGQEDKAHQKASQFIERENRLRAHYSGLPTVRVFYQVWSEPLITFSGKHLASSVIKLCGGENIFATALPMVPHVSIEAIVKAAPQAIIASGNNREAPQWLEQWQAWPSIPAVANSQVYAIPPDLMQRHSMRLLDGAAQLCTYLQQARSAAVPLAH